MGRKNKFEIEHAKFEIKKHLFLPVFVTRRIF